MKHRALKQLQEIIRLRDWTEYCPEQKREEALTKWIEDWIIEVEQSQSVVDSKHLNSDMSDFVKYRMGQVLGESLTEECVKFTIEKNKITATMLGIKRGK